MRTRPRRFCKTRVVVLAPVGEPYYVDQYKTDEQIDHAVESCLHSLIGKNGRMMRLVSVATSVYPGHSHWYAAVTVIAEPTEGSMSWDGKSEMPAVDGA